MIRMRVTPDSGEPYTIEPASRDVLLWERSGKGRSISRLSEEPAVADLYSLAHTAARRQGRISMSVELAEFEQSVDLDVDRVTDDDGDDGPAIADAMADTLGLESADVLAALREAWELVGAAAATPDPTRTAR